MKRRTKAELEAKVTELEAFLKNARDAAAVDIRLRKEATEREKLVVGQIEDLKERLVTAEAENARMRGYIARVQEDDVVREDLVTTGDPCGEQNLVPKRKPTHFHTPVPYMEQNRGGDTEYASIFAERGDEARRKPPTHWIRYG